MLAALLSSMIGDDLKIFLLFYQHRLGADDARAGVLQNLNKMSDY